MLAPLFLPSLLGMVFYAILIPLLIIIMGFLSLIMVYITQKIQQGG
jgi:hypothetical protein